MWMEGQDLLFSVSSWQFKTLLRTNSSLRRTGFKEDCKEKKKIELTVICSCNRILGFYVDFLLVSWEKYEEQEIKASKLKVHLRTESL